MAANASDVTGTVEVLTWREHLLGTLIFLAFFLIIVINVLFLVCFYRLRQHRSVKTARSVVSLVVTDLINALILTPTVIMWFTIVPPFTYSTCVVRSLPFMLANYTSLLNMCFFYVYRLFIIRQVATGSINVTIRKYSAVTVVVWVATPLVIAVPYLAWGRMGDTLLDCRRVLFTDQSAALACFAVMFDAPLVVTNASFVIQWIMLMKYRLKVLPHDTKTQEPDPDNSPRECPNCIGLPNKELIADILENPQKAFKDRKTHASVMFVNFPKKTTNTNDVVALGSVNNIHIISDDDQMSDTYEFASDNTYKPRVIIQQDASDTTYKPHVVIQKDASARNKVTTTTASHHCHQCASRADLHIGDNGERFGGTNNGTTRKVSEAWGPCCEAHKTRIVSIVVKSGVMTMGTDLDENCIASEMKQSLVTLGLLLTIYNVTTIPLILDINIATWRPAFLMPHELNSLCFLSAVFNPIVYTVRMSRIRQEMRLLLSTAWRLLWRCRQQVT